MVAQTYGTLCSHSVMMSYYPALAVPCVKKKADWALQWIGSKTVGKFGVSFRKLPNGSRLVDISRGRGGGYSGQQHSILKG